MAKITKPLTNTEVKQAKPKDKDYTLLDGEGLQLRVKTSGTKSWLFNYYHPITKKRKNLSLGQYPALTLAEARKQRASSKELLTNNMDPKEYRDDQLSDEKLKMGFTLKSIALDWFEVKKTKIAETTSKSLWRNFENHLFPSIGHRPIDKILAPEVIKTLKPLAGKGSLETLHKTIGHLNEVMKHAVNTGRIHHNPLAGISAAFNTPKVTHMATIKPEELPELMKAISYSNITLVTRCLLEFQLHTMVRSSEAAKASWDEIDFENMLWEIPAERMKMKVKHTVPLTQQVLNLLELVKPLTGERKYIFPADRHPNQPSGSERANKALQRIGFKGRLVAHGMRSLASTTLNEKGFDGDVIEAALAHQEENEVRRAYNRSKYLERRQKLMYWWSEHIEQAQTGKSVNTNVVVKLKGQG
ncbi:integrase domain-containing protein [Paraglaciecola sp. MB-3u-78]|uniref:integrase domain-containing protein n=1 Tax=Paraglaciecola sp. MB-3u-78 TaxID=2058332 RepID=UPI000C32C72F|nr:integrase domain-containing protein [Paraglaciecola sp. MB-3u-78]PKG99075.1 integrase [Paraglaciecola sp. MB-3u-78]